jgi:hypothetical protein
MVDQTILTWAAAILAVGGALAMLWKFLAPICIRIRKMMDSLDIFIKDWAGEDARPGHSRVPGVMERLQKIEGELKHNGGSSIKDAVKRIEATQTKILVRLEEGNERFEKIEEKLDD